MDHPAPRTHRLTSLGLALLAPLAPALVVLAPPALAVAAPCTQVLAAPTPAADLVADGVTIPDQPADPAASAALTAAVTAAAQDEAAAGPGDEQLWLDTCGKAYYRDDRADPVVGPSASSTTTTQLAPLTQTFALHSKPGSQRTIYIDADGFALASTAWNGSLYPSSSVTLPAYSMDASSAFSDAEKIAIQNMWAIVAEDYAPFDVDVTTQAPAPAALTRSGADDQVYGTRAVVTTDAVGASACGCGGIAYLGVFDDASSHDRYQPALAFTRGVGTGAKNLAEVISHEVGHNLGLTHQGTATSGYHGGANGWAPIMGVGYYQPVTQWARGEYAGANNQQDELAVLASHGAVARADDHGNDDATATALSGPLSSSPSRTGVIERTDDVDAFSFHLAASASVSLAVTTSPVAPDLDATLRLRRAGGAEVGVSAPDLVVTSSSVVSGTDAALSAVRLDAGDYVATVEGTGTAAFSDYGSLGQYTIRLTGAYDDAPAVTTSSLPPGTVATAYSTTLAGSAGTTWAVASGRLPTGLTLSSAGVLAGRPSSAATSTFTVRATDARGEYAERALSLRVATIPTVGGLTVTTASAGTAYSAGLRITGGVAPYAVTATSAPAWATVASDGTITGTPTQAEIATFALTVTDADGRSRAASLTLTVGGPLRIATTTLPNGQSLVAGAVGSSATLSAVGGKAPYTWTGVGLPAGVTISGGRLTARNLAVGELDVTAQVRDALGAIVTRTWTVRVVPPLTAATSGTAATVGSAVAAVVAPAGGTGPYRITAGTLPAGWSLDGDTLRGTPATTTAVSLPLTVRDADDRTLAVTVRVSPRAPLAAVVPSMPALQVGRSASVALRTTGGYGTVTWSLVDGALPDGLRLSASGVVSGVPTTAGISTLTAQARDAEGRVVRTSVLTLVVSG